MLRSEQPTSPHVKLSFLRMVIIAGLLSLSGRMAIAQSPTPNAYVSPADYDAYGKQFANFPAPKLPVTVQDINGRDVLVNDISRIVSLSGSITEIIFALGLGDHIIGVDSSALFPAEATEALPKVGYVRQLAAEGVLALDPTLIIGNVEAGPPEVLEQIEGAGAPVLIVQAPEETIDAPAAKVRAVSTALGVPDRGEVLAAQIEEQIAQAQALAARSSQHPTVMFLYIRQGTQLIAGSGTTAEAMITAAGGVNSGTEIGLEGYVPLTAEALVEASPDVILLLQGGLEAAGGVDGLLSIPGIAETPAGQHREFVVFDDLYLLGMGPRTGYALLDLVAALHPETLATPIASRSAGA